MNKIGKVLSFVPEYVQDLWLFLRHNSHSPFEERDRRLSYRTIIEAHTIEKGLTLPGPKPHFGRDKIAAVLDLNEGWTPPANDLSRSKLVGALRDYQQSFEGMAVPDAALAERISAFIASHSAERATGGIRPEVKPAYENPVAAAFLENRFSAREFGVGALTDSEMAAVVTLAQRAPSQCNRQSTRLHIYRDPSRIRSLLDLQGGARGFADNVPTLFVVTSVITAWGGPQQRNQPYVDGGIYAMMLMLGLDAKGFLTCPLNLAISNSTERAIKTKGDIPARERLVVMVAAGRQPDHTIRAANSPRWGVDDVCNVHD